MKGKKVMRTKGRKLPGLLLLALLLAMVFAGCGQQGSQGGDEPGDGTEKGEVSLHLDVESYPRVDGSTATIPLSEAFAAAVMDMAPEEARMYVAHQKTHAAYVNLLENKADLILVTSPSEEELAYAKRKGAEIEIVPIVSEGFVFLTNVENPVKGLTLKQIREIYSGKITNWQEVGGKDKQITAYQRPENSGSQTGMLDLVMGTQEMMTAPTEKIVTEMGGLIDQVAVYTSQEEGLGYSYFYYVSDMWQNDQVKLLAVDGVVPNKETISNASYPIRTAYYAVLRADEPADSSARQLLAWILSDEGQQVAEEAGYVQLGKN